MSAAMAEALMNSDADDEDAEVGGGRKRNRMTGRDVRAAGHEQQQGMAVGAGLSLSASASKSADAGALFFSAAPSSSPSTPKAGGAVGIGICEHGWKHRRCKECGGKGICEHGRRRYRCKECGGKRSC